MTSKKTTRRALLSSLLSLLLCCSMLLGTTFAWFTDSVTSANNIIKSGTLEVEMCWADGTKAVPDEDSTEWNDASKGPIFKNELWEPGYTEVRHIMIKNAGTLALKYQLGIKANGEVSKLTDVIDVYFADPAVQVNDRAALVDGTEIGTLTKILAGMPSNTAGTLKAEQSVTVTLALKMQEEAGNEYQNLSVGSDFAVVLMATQLTAEKDSFDNQYDEGAAWDGTIPAEMPETLVVDTEKKLISVNDPAAFAYLNTLVNASDFADTYGSKWKYSIELNTDINLFSEQWTPINLSDFVAFDGKGHTISNLNVSAEKNAGLFGEISCNDIGVTYVKNLNIDGADVRGEKCVGALVGNGRQAVVENVTVNDATVVGVKYVGGIFGWGNGSVNNSTVKNSKIIIDTLVIDESNNSIDSKEAGGLIGYVSNDGKATTENKVIAGNTVENVTITAPSIASGLVAQPNSSNKDGAVIEIKNNTMKNVTITTTHDASADLYVSNNVGGKTIVESNTAVDCKIGVGVSTAEALAKALTADAESIVVALANDIDLPIASLGAQTPGSGEYKLGGEQTKDITIDLNGKKLNITTTYWSAIGAKNDDAVFTIKNGSMTSSQATGTWNSYDLTFANCNYVIEDVTFDKAVALSNEGKTATLNNVTINETHDYYAMWITAEGQTVTIDGLTVNSDGRGIKIDEQYVDAPAKVTLNVANAEFTTAKKAAIVVKSAAGADITLSNVDITKVAADPFHAVWVDEDAAAYADKVTVNGGKKTNEADVGFATMGGVRYENVGAAVEAAGENAVIDLGNKTFAEDEAIKPAAGQTLTIANGTITAPNAGLENSGTATLSKITMNAGSAADYSNISRAGSVTTYNDVKVDSAGGGIGAVDGGSVVFNSGSVAVNTTSTSGRYIFYAEGEGTVITINGGEFSFSKTLNQKRAYIYAGAGTTVYVNGGTFGPASTRSGYTAGILGDGAVIIKGGTFGFDPSNWLADGYQAVKDGSTWTVSG